MHIDLNVVRTGNVLEFVLRVGRLLRPDPPPFIDCRQNPALMESVTIGSANIETKCIYVSWEFSSSFLYFRQIPF
jgi:hypothetical protein